MATSNVTPIYTTLTGTPRDEIVRQLIIPKTDHAIAAAHQFAIAGGVFLVSEGIGDAELAHPRAGIQPIGYKTQADRKIALFTPHIPAR